MMIRYFTGCLVLVALTSLSVQAARPNVLFVAIDDLRNDLGCLEASHAKTPSLDAFAATARVFDHHYVQVPTCGASRCALLRGRYPNEKGYLSNNAIKQTGATWRQDSLPALFMEKGYQTLALGKITHYPGGFTGKDWQGGAEEISGVWTRQWLPENHPWKTPQAIMHGYANGEARVPGQSPALEAYEGDNDHAYPDAWVADSAITALQQLAARPDDKPWLLAVGFFKPHLPFAAPKKWHDLHAAAVAEPPLAVRQKPAWPSSGWHASGEMNGNYHHPSKRLLDTDEDYAKRMRQAYAACISYMDAQLGRVLKALQEQGLADNTIVVVWSDHGMLLGEHGIWGKHCLYEEALRSPLMIRVPGQPSPGLTSKATVETVDILPTLAELCGLRVPDNMDGSSLVKWVNDPKQSSTKPARSFWTGGQQSVRTERWRLVLHPTKKAGGTPMAELFDYQEDPFETLNHAATYPEVVRELTELLHAGAAVSPAKKN